MTKETSDTVASLAGRILAGGNPLDNEQVMSAIALGLMTVEKDTGAEMLAEALSPLRPYFDNMLSLAGSCLSQAEDEKIMVPTEINWDQVANAFVGAVEGGSTDWLNAFLCAPDEHSQNLRRSIKLKHDVWYATPEYWRENGGAVLKYDNPSDGPDQVERTIGKHNIIVGLRLMADKSPRHFTDLITENDDAITHDVMVQYIVFGEIVYG